METSVNQRLNDIVNFLIFSKVALDKTDLSKKLGYNASSFSQIINERVPLTDRFVNRLMEFAPNINKDWLLTGEGEMLKVPATVTVYNPTQDERQEVGENIDLSVVPVQVVEEIKAEVAEEIRAEVVEEVKAEIEEAISVPLVSSKVANNATINIRKFVEKQGDEMERINPSNLVAHADIAERIRKGSMMPTFMPGDIVFVQFLDDKKIIADGHTYYFDLRDRPTIIRKVKFEGNKLRLIADNPNYGDIMTTFDEIDNVADIVGMFRTMFANQYADIEEVRRKKDEQVDSLIKEVSKAGVRVDKMMEQMSLLVKHAIEKK